MITSLIAVVLALPPQSPSDKLGIGLEGIGGRGLEFVDVMKTSRAWESLDGKGPAPTDPNGWPTTDARTVAMDLRPTMAWAPPMDDPDGYQIDVSGTYTLSFLGKANVSPGEDPSAFQVRNVRYDDKSKTTTADVVVPKGKALIILNFQGTNRGVKNVRLLRPGYPAATKEVFHRPFLKAIQPFPVLRFMDWLESNSTNPFYGDVKNTTEWSDRHLPTDATQGPMKGKHGVAWEYVAALCKQTGKTPWINLPVAASNDYVRRVAELFRKELGPKQPIYLEYNNEVWNWGFLQATYNKMAAEAEVAAGGSNLNNDGSTDKDLWRRRRMAKRTIEIGRIFAEVYGPGSLNNVVRPVLSWQVVAPQQFREQLDWVSKTYGPPKNHLYAIAGAPYFNADRASKTAGASEILDALRQSSESSLTYRREVIRVARDFSLKPFCYEGGPDTGGGDPTNVANRIRAHRDPRMREIILRDLKNHWFDQGGDLFMYFTLTSAASRYGYWGLTDDVTRLDTPKWQAIHQLIGNQTQRRRSIR